MMRSFNVHNRAEMFILAFLDKLEVINIEYRPHGDGGGNVSFWEVEYVDR